MTINHDNIDELLARFFEGNTSCAEDKALQQFFTTQAIPLRLKQYIPMFRWYADGMPEQNAVSVSAPAPAKPVVKKWISGVAASVAVTLAAGWSLSAGNQGNRISGSAYEGSYSEVNGVIMTDFDDIKSEIKITELEATLLELELQASESQASECIEDLFS